MKTLFKEDIKSKLTRFLEIKSIEDLSSVLEIKRTHLVYYAYKLPEVAKYRIFEIAKRDGGKKRQIQAPIAQVKLLQKKLLEIFGFVYIPKHCVHGFVSDRSVKSNAKPHLRKTYLLNVDLEDFFGSIHFGRIYGLFQSTPFGFSKEVAAYLAQICSFSGHLPQGAPTSPILANMVAYTLDKNIMEIAQQNRLNYTRYSDDISFSTADKEIGLELSNPKSTLRKIISDTIISAGFRLNNKKTRFAGRYDHKEVTGILVNSKLNVRRQFYRNIRAMLHAWEHYGYLKAEKEYKEKYDKRNRKVDNYDGPIFSKVVKGKIDWLQMVRGRDGMYHNLQRSFFKLMDRDRTIIESGAAHIKLENKSISQFRSDQFYENCVLVLEAYRDKGDEFNQGSAFFIGAKTLLTCAHCLADMNTKLIYPKIYLYKPIDPSVKYTATVLSINTDCDLALLYIENKDHSSFSKLRLCSESWIFQHNQDLTIYGYPEAAPDRSIRIEECKVVGKRNRFGVELIEVNGGIYQGNSGGPVVNSRKEVVGVAAVGTNTVGARFSTDAHCFIPIKYRNDLKVINKL